jgi:hypothetical protein
MRTITRFVLNTEERRAIKNVVDTIGCDCECEQRSDCHCPFLMENGGCMLEAMKDILDEQEREDFI